jgi:cation diffusion facilitator CzcD-associated flavoprotein CzcO
LIGIHENATRHTANVRSSNRDWTGQRIALIGCGSSAIQILPHLQKKSTAVYNFVRGGTWISQPFGSSFTESILAQTSEPGNYSYTEQEKQKFASDPEYYKKFRKEMESFINKDYPCLFPGTIEQTNSTKKIQENMQQKLLPKPGQFDLLKPNFLPGCRRLTPGPGYMEALVKENVQLIQTPITRVTENSVVTEDGKIWEVDAIACATGFDSSYMPRFPIIGRNGVSLSSTWNDHASAYLSHSVPGFPNYFMAGGPNSATGGGSLLLILESVMNYIVKAVAKISREHIKSMEVKESSLAQWSMYLDQYFPKTVHVDSCTSWYKVNGKIVGLWPGSSLHAMKTLENPRWEDFSYEALKNRSGLDWIGNGWTMEDVKRGDLSYYLDHTVSPPVPTEDVLAAQP